MALADQAGTSRTIKPDGTIVTPADSKVEEFLRGELTRLVPDTGIYGEEMGSSAEGPNGLWCLDPIDGTSNYAFGSPLWGVSAGLVRGEDVLIGAVYLPALNEMYIAAMGSGASLNGKPLTKIPPGSIRKEELVSYPDRILRMYPNSKLPGKMRHTGAFVIDAVFTAAQRFRGLLGVREKLYDVAASLCIGHEVGAEIRYADGSPLKLGPLKPSTTKLEKGWIMFPPDTGFRLP